MGFALLYPSYGTRMIATTLRRRRASPGAPAPRGDAGSLGCCRDHAPLERRSMRHGAGAPWRSVGGGDDQRGADRG